MLPLSRGPFAVAFAGLCLLLIAMGVGTMLRRRLPPPAAPPLPAVGVPANAPATTGTPANAPADASLPVTPVPARQPVVVHVAGCVRCPGVYSFADGARVCDALKRAGGAKPNADLDAINQAARLEDGKQLFVPRKQASERARVASRSPRRRPETSFWMPPAELRLEPIPPGRMPLVRPKPTAPRAQEGPESKRGEGERPGKIRSPADGRVNINRADAAELQRLPGVGKATADFIIEYRKTNGPFRSVEQLLEVRGIGDKKLAKLRDLVEL